MMQPPLGLIGDCDNDCIQLLTDSSNSTERPLAWSETEAVPSMAVANI